MVELILASDAMVYVYLLALNEARLQVIVGQAAELKLECQGGLDVTNRLFLLPNAVPIAKGVVPRVLSTSTEYNRHAAKAPLCKYMLLVVEEGAYLFRPFGIRHVIGLIENSEGQVQDVRG
jgi:hypothetical protein